MNIICWNCRGAGGKGFPTLIRDLRRNYEAHLIILLETHVSGDRGKIIRNKMGFDSCCVEEARGHSGGVWDANKLRTWLPEELVEKIIAMTPPSPWKDDDQLAWNVSSDGTFNLRSAYNSLDRNPSMPVQVFKYVWKWNGPERIRYLLWLVTNEAILTNATRARRHMTNIANCPRCNAEEETTIHVLRDCQFARKVWSSLVPQDHLSEFFNTDLPE
ncbi:hypothetical protein Ahy_A07g032688 [Arachis hypogaea]|uniref:Reverse transcriptase zinc-binding domain-containing protein n=1 Tax=Arachis hypogaea TaxID=3818 RepID=A0A445C7C2_ARAHY|nr:hypothetical protein Ahy_A07g032688 [Arachis hypogaea]